MTRPVVYNVNTFPLAAGVFQPFTLAPEVAARLMSDSSAVMAINALTFKRTKLAGIRQPQPPGGQAGRRSGPFREAGRGSGDMSGPMRSAEMMASPSAQEQIRMAVPGLVA